MKKEELNYFEKSAEILTKVFRASRLQEEVSSEMVRLLSEAKKIEMARSTHIIEKINEYLIEAGYVCDRKRILKDSTGKEVIISGRIKTIVSAVYNLLAPKNGHYQDLNDMIGLMLICEDEEACYDIKNILVEKLKENGDRIISEKDMIANPKKNGYQSIHLHVDDEDGIVFEIQIKSYKMFAYSQTGDCKHELYKKRLVTNMLSSEEWIIFDSLREECWF